MKRVLPEWQPRRQLPRAMIDAVLAPGHGDQFRARATRSWQLLTVSKALPRIWRVDLSPAAVIRIIALVRALRKVSDVAGRDQQRRHGRARCSTALSKTVHAVAPVHLAEITEGHVIHDGAKLAGTGEHSAVATDAFTCRC